MEVELWSGTTKAIIDPIGAWITNMSDDYGDILFPKRSLKTAEGEVKVRGGCHVCLPNFGPGGASGQPQHGFGRELQWKLRGQTNNSVTLELMKGRGEYESLSSELTYTLGDTSLRLMLEVINHGKEDLRVAPAFHPYFALLGDTSVIVNDEDVSLEDLSEALFETADSMQLRTSSRAIRLKSLSLPVWAKWTDQLGSYLCIEPTVDGFTFLRGTPSPEEMLAPGQHKTYSLEIAW